MRFLILLAMVFYSVDSYAGDDSRKECKIIFQAWVLNTMLESTCKFGGALSYRLGVLAKSACGDVLSETDVKEFASQVAMDLKKDYKRMGKERLCEDAKPGYEGVVKDFH
jgi:hypothetical protein